jgi:hypothetical protein
MERVMDNNCTSRLALLAGASFVRRDEGAITALSLFLLIASAMIGGIALDVANVMNQRTKLQVTADSAAHAALVERVGLRWGEFKTEAEAVDFAIELARTNMPPDRYGNVLIADEIEFGFWINSSQVPLEDRFTQDVTPNRAVRVHSGRNENLGNAIPTFLLRMVGLDMWNVTTPSVFMTYQPICLREGFVAEGRVDMQSNNEYLRGFCVHSNSYVSINQNNYFEEGTIVSMPDLDLLELPNSGYEKNEGLEAALREGSMDLRILRELDTIIAGLRSADRDFIPDYITSTAPNDMTLTQNNNKLTQDDLVAGAVNDINCTRSGGKISIPNSEVIRDVVIVTNCSIEMGSNARIENSVVATTSTSATSITGASGSTFGEEDDCAPGGGTQVITLGGLRFPSDLGIFGSQLLAAGDVEFAARADGIQGASIVAGGEIDATSNSTMALCNSGMEGNFELPYFRMVM